MIWREQKNHYDDCFLYDNSVTAPTKTIAASTVIGISSATRSIRHSGTVPIPIFHQAFQESEDNKIETSEDENYDFEYCGESSNLKTFSQSQI